MYKTIKFKILIIIYLQVNHCFHYKIFIIDYSFGLLDNYFYKYYVSVYPLVALETF